MMKLLHVINPVRVGVESDLYIAQPVTFRSMLKAKEYSRENVSVDLCSISYPEDHMIVPDEFRHLDDLKRSVLDVGCFKKQRKLPLIKDILDAAVSSSNAEYIIYSNVDISLMPYFYEVVAEELKKHDALVINRRTIAKSNSADIPLSYFYSQIGVEHPGFDCFVFRRTLYDKFYLGDACIGANWIGRIQICNILAYADSTKMIEDAHLTFHLGDDRSWKTAENADYDEHNEAVTAELIDRIENQGLLNKHSLLQRTYDEFFVKSKDPDPSRQKIVEELDLAIESKVDRSLLPNSYLPSSGWDHKEDNLLRQDPVFIVGHPRSGTTLLQSLVATQYAPAIFPETHFFSIVRSKLDVKKDVIQPECLKDALDFLNEKLVLSDNIKKYMTDMVNKIQLSPKMLFEAIVFDQLSRYIPVNEISAIPWMEKTPDHVEHLDVVKRYYPNAKIIFVVRNPEKAILSRRKNFTWNNESNWPVSKHVDRWILSINSYEKFKLKHSDSAMSVRFEDVIQNKEKELRNICDFLSVQYSADKLNEFSHYSKQQNLPWETWKQDAVNEVSSVVAFKSDDRLSNSDRVVLVDIARDYLEKYGYLLEISMEESYYTRIKKLIISKVMQA